MKEKLGYSEPKNGKVNGNFSSNQRGKKKISAQKMLMALFYFQAPVNNRINSIWSFIYQNASGLASSHFR